MKAFRYPLDPILKQYEWEIDALRIELMNLNQMLSAKTQELTKLKDSVHQAEQEILDICRENVIIARDRKAIVETYLNDLRQRTEQKQQEFLQTQALADGVMQQLNKKRQSQRGMEKHRERKRKDFDVEGMRQDALEIDELWLSKIAAGRSES